MGAWESVVVRRIFFPVRVLEESPALMISSGKVQAMVGENCSHLYAGTRGIGGSCLGCRRKNWALGARVWNFDGSLVLLSCCSCKPIGPR